jgi:hypothetical protein
MKYEVRRVQRDAPIILETSSFKEGGATIFVDKSGDNLLIMGTKRHLLENWAV